MKHSWRKCGVCGKTNMVIIAKDVHICLTCDRPPKEK